MNGDIAVDSVFLFQPGNFQNVFDATTGGEDVILFYCNNFGNSKSCIDADGKKCFVARLFEHR